MVDVDTNVTELRPSPARGGGKDPTAALRARRSRKKRKAVTSTVTTSVTQPSNLRSEKINEIKPSVTVVTARVRTISVPLTGLAYGFFALGISINVWNARTGTLADMALPAAMGVLAEGVMFFLPAWAIRLPWGRQAAAWALLVFVSAFALTNSLRMASIVATDQAMARAERETAGTAQAGHALDVARASRDAACGRGLGKTVACQERKAEVAKLEARQAESVLAVQQKSRPESADFAGLVSWMTMGAIHPGTRDFDMLWLLFRTFLPKSAGWF